MIKPVFICIAIALLLTSCEKEKSSQGSKLSRILSGGLVSSEYLYNAQGNLLKTKSYGNEESYIYDSDGKLTKIERANSYSSNSISIPPKFEYSYSELSYSSDGKLNTLKNYLLNGTYQLTSTTVPEYDASGKIISNTILLPGGQAAKKFVYQYDSKGNIVVMEFYQYNTSPVLSMRSVYEYDNQNNPYINIGVPPFSISKNNITKIIETNYVINPGSQVVTTTSITYKSYTKNGYPKIVNESGADHTYEYQ